MWQCFKGVISKQMQRIKSMTISCEIVLRWIPLNTFDHAFRFLLGKTVWFNPSMKWQEMALNNIVK